MTNSEIIINEYGSYNNASISTSQELESMNNILDAAREDEAKGFVKWILDNGYDSNYYNELYIQYKNR